MARVDNYKIQAQQARDRFLTYDQQKLIAKLRLKADENYLYTALFDRTYRINRKTGDLERLEGDAWLDANTFGEVLTLMDLVCDSREDRRISGRWANMLSFGGMFHRNLLEEGEDSLARRIQENPEAFCRVCESMGTGRAPGGDLGCTFELFDGLKIALQFWYGDEEFAPRVRFLWDENALMYLKYETMWFALGMLRKRIVEEMDN